MIKMKRTVTGVLCGWALAASGTLLAEALAPIESQFLFVPKGFDDNDKVEIVLDGYMPSTCYRQAEPTFTVDVAAKVITVQAMAKVYEGPCLLVLVPYTEVVNVGSLPKGDYTVKTLGLDGTVISIAQSTNSGPDDFLYAPVDTVNVTVMPEQQKIELEIRGRFTNTCMTSDKVNVIDSEDTLEVLPVIKVADRPDCHEEEFSYKPMIVELPWRKAGRYLAHVRSLNGKSANHVFSVYGE